MAMFLGIGGPWIVLMVLDLLATRRDVDSGPPVREEPMQERLTRLLRRRDVSPRAARGIKLI